MRVDAVVTPLVRRVRPYASVPLDNDPRLAIITVNFSTTRLLKLMLLTLSEQSDLSLVKRIVVIDNRSRDGATSFLELLELEVDRVTVVRRRRFLSHARGMRAGVRELDRLDGGAPDAANLLLFCDTDIVFRNPDTLGVVATLFVEEGAAALGEARAGRTDAPDIQASFYAVRRDVNSRSDVVPLLDGGSPALEQQRSSVRALLPIVHFPSNHGGWILHRGRGGVAAAAEHRPMHRYASVTNRSSHFMGVPDGAQIWAEREAEFAQMLDGDRRVIDVLRQQLGAANHPPLARQRRAMPSRLWKAEG